MNALSAIDTPPQPRTEAEERQFDAAMLAALPKLRAAALVWTRDFDQAADLVQDTVEKALRYRQNFLLGTNMSAWLCFIGRNQFYSQKRRAWRMTQMPVMVGKDGTEVSASDLIPTPATQGDNLELEELRTALSYLPKDMADAIRLIAIDGMTYEEAATELETEVGTIKSRVSRGRNMLDQFFDTDRKARR